MARQKAVIRKLPRGRAAKPRTVKFADMRYMGEEPIENVKIESDVDPRFIAALRWYDYYYDADVTKKWLVEYLTASKLDKTLINHIRSLPAWKISKTNGTIARLIQRGWTLTPGVIERFQARIQALYEEQAEVVADVPAVAKPKINLQDRVRNRAVDLMEIVEQHIDNFFNDNEYEFSLYQLLVAEKASPVACNLLQEKIEAIVADFDNEGFENFSKKKMKAYKAFYNAMLADIATFRMNKKAVKVTKPRKIREKQPEKLVAKAKYMKEYAPLKLVSIPPQQVIKATSLWVYNTKYRQLTVYHAQTTEGLSIKGTSIINFDESKSETKRIRKPEITLPEVLNAGKVALRTLMEKIKATGSRAKGRLNSDTILLRVS